MLRKLREHGEIRFGPNVLKTQHYNVKTEVLTEVYSQLARESVMAANGLVAAPAIPLTSADEEYCAYEFVHFYNTYADYEFNPTESGAELVVNHSYARFFHEDNDMWKALWLDVFKRSIRRNHYDDLNADSILVGLK